jgi:hypothetical protein
MEYFEQNCKGTYRNAVTQVTAVAFTDLDAQTKLNRSRGKFLSASAKDILKFLKKTSFLIIMVPKDKPDDSRKNANDLIKNTFRETSVKTLRSFVSINDPITIKDKRDLLEKLVGYIKILTFPKPTVFANVESGISKFTVAVRNQPENTVLNNYHDLQAFMQQGMRQ